MIIYLLLLTFVCVFLIYCLSRNDFVLLRKNISISGMFDFFFLNLLTSFFVARLFFILDEKKFSYLYPINFLHVFKLHGMSMYGFFLGLCLGFLILLLFKKLVPRAIDIFLISIMPYYFLMFGMRGYGEWSMLIYLVISILLVVLTGLFIKLHNEYRLRDGNISILLIILFSIDSFVSFLFTKHTSIFSLFNFTQVASIIIFISLSILLIFRVTEQDTK